MKQKEEAMSRDTTPAQGATPKHTPAFSPYFCEHCSCADFADAKGNYPCRQPNVEAVLKLKTIPIKHTVETLLTENQALREALREVAKIYRLHLPNEPDKEDIELFKRIESLLTSTPNKESK